MSWSRSRLIPKRGNSYPYTIVYGFYLRRNEAGVELINTRKLTGIKLNDQMTRIPAGSIQRYLAKLAK